jgi:hypothetical protein
VLITLPEKKDFLTTVKERITNPFAQTAANIDRLEKKGLLFRDHGIAPSIS